MPGSGIDKSTENSTEGKTTGKPAKNVDDLTGRVCYFSLAGNLALESFVEGNFSTYDEDKKKKKTKDAVTERLYFALLMFDAVVLHCSDPLRSQIVFEVLNDDFKDMIKEGRILFIFSNHINNIRDDYRKYIDEKYEEYKEGSGKNESFSEKEADSLKPEYATDEYYNKVIDLLELTPYLVRKVSDSAYSFQTLVSHDLSPTSSAERERIVIDSAAPATRILSLGMTLYQLLNARSFLYNGEGKFSSQPVFESKAVETIVETLKKRLNQGNVISRSAIVEAMEKNNIKFIGIKEHIRNAITLRMDILYCRMNCGNNLILEFHPAYEYRGIYQLDCFVNFCNSLSINNKKHKKLTKEMFEMLSAYPQLDLLRSLFIECMSDNREIMATAVFDSEVLQYKQKLETSFGMLLKKRLVNYKEELEKYPKELEKCQKELEKYQKELKKDEA